MSTSSGDSLDLESPGLQGACVLYKERFGDYHYVLELLDSLIFLLIDLLSSKVEPG